MMNDIMSDMYKEFDMGEEEMEIARKQMKKAREEEKEKKKDIPVSYDEPLTREEVAQKGRETGRQIGRTAGIQAGTLAGGALAGIVTKGLGVPVGAKAGASAGVMVGDMIGKGVGESVGERTALLVYDEFDKRGLEMTPKALEEELMRRIDEAEIREEIRLRLEDKEFRDLARYLSIEELKDLVSIEELKGERVPLRSNDRGNPSGRSNPNDDFKESLEESFDMGYREGTELGKQLAEEFLGDVDVDLLDRHYSDARFTYPQSAYFANHLLPELRELAGYIDPMGVGTYRTIPDDLEPDEEYAIHEKMEELLESYWEGFYAGMEDGRYKRKW